jgi:colanic acid/amylovoran biosynthesis glycosyltransferase
LHQWRGKRDSLRLHQAVYLGPRLRELGATHVHAHFAGMAARTAYWIREFFGIPFSVTVHANDIFAPEEFEIGLEKILSSAGAIIAVSDFAAAFLREHYPNTTPRVHRVYNGIELDSFTRARFLKPPLILSVGRLIRKKGFDLLIDACRILRERGAEFRCEIVGEGPLREALEALISAHDLSECVKLVGTKTQREITDRLSEATLFALLCRVEDNGAMDNLPTVIMEAMAAGLPVVSTAVGGIEEMVRDRETGLVVPADDACAAADAIQHLLENRVLPQALGQHGRKRAEELFSIDKNVHALRRIFATCSSGL